MADTDNSFYSELVVEERQRFIANMALGCGTITGVFVLSFAWLLDDSMVPPDLGRAGLLISGLVSCLFLAAHLFARCKRVGEAAWLIAGAIGCLIVIPPFSRHIGIFSLNLAILPILIIFAGFLGGTVAARRACLLGVLVLLLVYAATRTGLIAGPLIPQIDRYFPAEQFLSVHLGIMLIVAWITTWYARVVHESHAQLRQRATDLESVVADLEQARQTQELLNVQLAERTREAESGSRAKSRFLMLMSHEIRTPLNGVIGVAQLLKKGRMDEPVRDELLDTIIASGTALHALTTDILDLSRVGGGGIELLHRPLDVPELLQQVMLLFAPAARSKHLWLGAVCLDEQPVAYMGDNLRLGQMLSNLVGNAIKYTETGGVNITARERSREGGAAVVEFTVTDTGIGIDQGSRSFLFEPFSQVEEVLTRRQGGAGLGLAIVRQFAERMDGEVGVESSPGEGSRFWFTVKLAIAGEVAPGV